jgi:hypothetical protein
VLAGELFGSGGSIVRSQDGLARGESSAGQLNDPDGHCLKRAALTKAGARNYRVKRNK